LTALPLRPAARALVVRDGALLTIVNQPPGGRPYYLLPGGDVEPGESLEAAAVRECLEETGLAVTCGPLRFVRDVVLSRFPLHCLDFIYECRLTADTGFGPVPDTEQIAVEWLPLSDLPGVTFYPREIVPYVTGARTAAGTLYFNSDEAGDGRLTRSSGVAQPA
jgi:8-oxo-dGTP pyrophosphatase MutT (NUDIX family)